MNFRLLKYEHKMEVLLEFLIIEIIFLQSKFSQSYWTNFEKIKFSFFVFRSTPRCIFQKCIYPKCIFAKCTRLALVLSFASLFHFLQAFLPRLIIQSDCSRVVWCELLSCSGALSPRRPRRQSFYLKAKLII